MGTVQAEAAAAAARATRGVAASHEAARSRRERAAKDRARIAALEVELAAQTDAALHLRHQLSESDEERARA